MSNYIFDSTGGCARCDGMPEEHETYPKKPHILCQCKIRAKKKNKCYKLSEVQGKKSGFEEKEGDEFRVTYVVIYDTNLTCLKTGIVEPLTDNYDGEVTIHKDSYKGKDATLKELLAEFKYNAMTTFVDMAKEMCNC